MLALAIALAGCPSARVQHKPTPVVYDSPRVINPTESAMAMPVQADGSLFNPTATGWSLYRYKVAALRQTCRKS